MSNELHVIFGTGPVGCWTARALSEQGCAVRAVNRSGKRPELMPADVEMVAADASDPAQAASRPPKGRPWSTRRSIRRTTSGTSSFPACRPVRSPLRRRRVRATSRSRTSTCTTPRKRMTEDSPIAPVSRKGELRQRMAEEVMAAHDAR